MLLALSAFAQTEVVHSDDFQAYKTPSNPPGWVDTSIGNPKPQASGLYKAWNDPLQGNHGPNVVYGTKQSSGKPEGNNPRIGTFSTLITKRFDARGRFEYTGRLIRTNNDSRIGLTFLSSYPEVDKYYLIGLWSQAGAPPLTMQLFGFGAGTLQGTVNSNISIDINKWYRFSIQVEDVDNSTKIRAKFWADGTAEPTTWAINAVDAAATRLTTGRIGMWAAAKGDSYIDDIAAKSPVDHSAPAITFVNAATQQTLDPAQLALFQAPARVEIRVTDDLSTVTYTAKLDGTADYVSATPIATDGLHRITVNAIDGPGNTATASLDLLVDQVPPVITLQINGAPFAPGAIFNDDVTLGAVIQDISAITSVATLNGAAVTLPQPIAEERVHAISVTATDQVGRQSTAASSFIVDKTAPVVTILADGVELGGGESFQNNVTLTWSAADLTFDRIEATLNGTPITSGTTVSAERTHDLIVKAYDKAGHVTTETRRFILDKTAPEVRVLANGDTFHPGTTFNAPVTFTVDASDSTPTTTTVTIDDQPYNPGTAFGTQGPHTIKVVVRDAGGLATTVGPSPFTIDLTPPTITLTESGEPFRDGLKFNRDVNPVVTAADNLTATPLRELFLNGREFPLDTPVSEEKADHVITAKATDDGGNSTSIGPFHFILDKTKPVVTIVEETTGQPFEPDALFARPVRVKITVADLTATTIAATLNGQPFDPAGSVTADGTYTVSVVATDEVGWQNEPVTATFTIDRTPPHLTFTSHADNAVVSTPTVILAGGSDDAITISIAGAQAAVDLTAKTFLSEPVALVEGTNTITATGTDKAGNVGTAELRLELDTRAPEIAILTPATDACVDATTLTVTGTVSDPRVASVKVNGIAATLTNGAFTATVPVDEGPQLLTFVAADTLGHLTTITRSILVDRTAPALEVRESGAPFTGTLFNRAITLLARAVDADPSAQLTMTLDGAPYTSGTSIDAEGAHTLAVTAVDCANHRTTQTFAFTIDRTPPSIASLNPANGATVGALPTTIAGTTDADTATVELLGTAISVTPAGAFTLANVSFAEGTNRFVLRATDRAGNSAQVDYTVIVKTAAPVVTILEGGSPLEPNSLFTRAVTPEIRVDDATATLTATLNNAPYTSGTAITADGDYRLKATATDSLNHTGTAEVAFSIDRTAPAVQITFPPSGSVATEQVEVRGVATNAVAVDVNGKAVVLDANGAFVLPSLHLEFGPTRIIATARDRAGNIGTAEVEVTRDDIRPGIVLTYPPDRSVTNRPATEVLGRVLSPNPDGVVTIGTQTTPVDPLGAFHLSGYPLVEGDNTITVSTKTNNGGVNSASVVVTADFTPPALALLESSQPLNDGARFATEAALSLQASDNRGSVTTELMVDGVKVPALPHSVTATGGHIAVAVARDQAGNETHVERTFFIGATGGGAATCSLSDFDPASNAVVLSSSTTLLGRTTSAGVKANDVAASVADGSFRATVELPQEGANTVILRCTDGAGAAFGDAVTITLNRVTGDPSIEITAPAEGFVTADETITVTGNVGPGVTTADVNGAAAVITGNDASVARPFSVAGVRLAGGLNILAARGRNAAGRVATASRRVTALRSEPTIVISSPLSGAITGAPKIELAGTFADLDPATIAVTNVTSGATAAVQTTRLSDTTGTFVAAEIALVSGEQTLRVTGRDQANLPATATVTVRLTAGAPSIAITSPANNAYFGASAGNTFTVSGTFSGAPGATVDVGGTAATLNGSAFTATAPFTAIGNNTTVVARVTEPAGASAIDTVTITRLATAPKVLESFPAPNAVEVDSGAALLVLFSAPMDRASLANGAFRLEDANGATVTGTLFLDDDVLTFAPAALLARGARYTLRVTTAAKDLAGTSLDSEWTAAFTIGTSAPSIAPTLTPVSEAFCGQTVAIQGTAPAGARVQLSFGTLALTTVADAQGNFTFTLPLSGQSGYAIVRVRIAGSDGSLSPAAERTFRVDCVGPQVLNATYDRGGANRLTIDFSEPVDIPAGAISVTLTDGRTIAVNSGIPAEDLTARSFTLHVTTAVRDTLGNPLAAPYTQTFTLGGEQPIAGDGSGFISGEIYDATTGRPLAGATITVEIPGPLASSPADVAASRAATPAAVRGDVTTNSFTATTDSRGRYLVRLPEGAHTIRASKTGYTSVWRQIIVPAGAGVVPIDIRLTRQGDTGGETAITRPVTLTGATATLTAIGAQALPGLLPLGWSPVSAAEVAGNFTAATLTFTVPATNRNLTAVRYDELRDEWNVLQSVATITGGNVTLPITAQGAYALVYPDTAPALIGPVLTDLGAPAPTAPLVSRSFTLDPPVVLPNGRTVATLEVEGDFPSGTAVQAYIDEELRLADGSRLLDPPFATDLLLYRNLAGTLGTADFHLAPSPRAAQVILEIGFDHIRVVPYPGRLDRGTLIGNEGGRIPAACTEQSECDQIAVDIPAGATPEPLRASAVSLTQQDLDAVGTIQGFQIVGGFTFTLQRATQGDPDAAPVELFKPARATFSLSTQHSALSTQLVLVELLDQTPYGKLTRLANQIERLDQRATTKTVDRSTLPLDGIVREGRYLLLAADAPIAFATGVLRMGGRLLHDARITANALGVADLTRAGGIYNIPVVAAPAAPFTLTPRHTGTGDGAPYTHASSPATGAIVHVDLALVPQPPAIAGVTVTAGQPPAQVSLGGNVPNVSPSTGVRAAFTPAIDPASVTDTSITVLDAETGIAVPGRSTAEGAIAVNWALTAGTTLQSGHRYTVLISPRIRATNGAELAAVTAYGFTTATVIPSTEVRAERIAITIPDANGLSRVTGSAGALPANWQAVAVRRGIDFVTRYQSTAAADGSFTFLAGNGGDAGDRVTIADVIDLRVVNSAGNLAAIIPLTPFVTEDRRGFIVPAGGAARFVTADGITVDVAEGTFDEATLVTAVPEAKQTFDDIPSLDHDVDFGAGVKLDFEGRANKPIELELPVPAGLDTTNRNLILTLKGDSSRGPRLFAVDTLRVVNGRFTTTADPSPNARRVSVENVSTNQTLTGIDIKDHVVRVVRPGQYLAAALRGSAEHSGWAALSGFNGAFELHSSALAAFYTPHWYMTERSMLVIPILKGLPFTIVGVDANTGAQAFSKAYDPIPLTDGMVSALPSPQNNDGGPYPVYSTAFRIESLDLNIADADILTIRNFVIRLANGKVRVSTSSTDPLPPDTKIEVLNVSEGTYTAGTAATALTLDAELGQHIVLAIDQRDVDPNTGISVVFNEPIAISGTEPEQIDAFLRGRFRLERSLTRPAGSTLPPIFTDISDMVTYTADSGGRRINLTLPSSLQRESTYRLTLSKDIADAGSATGTPGLTLGQAIGTLSGSPQPVGGGKDVHLEMRTRKPGGVLGNFDLQRGFTRALALNGNVLLVANGFDLLAYDVADPASMNGVPTPIAVARGNGTDFWTVASDHHGRIYTTNLGDTTGSLRSYRLEDFLQGEPKIIASALISWRPGYGATFGVSAFLTDRPESFPRKLTLAVQDKEESYTGRDVFLQQTGATAVQDYPNNIKKLRATFAFDPANAYLNQRVTVENLTLDMRWSADATPASSAVIEDIIAGPHDLIRVLRNQTTYGVVSHLGHGVGVYDLNAIESNRAPSKPAGYQAPTEQIVLTRGVNRQECFGNTLIPPSAIPDISLSSDAAVRPDEASPHLYIYATDPHRGLLDMRFELPTPATPRPASNSGPQCGTRSAEGMNFHPANPANDHPRIAALKAAYRQASGGREPYAHFYSVASYRWSLRGVDNKHGERWSLKNKDVVRDYTLIAGGDLGLMVVEVNGNPVPQTVLPNGAPSPLNYYPLIADHLADIIWIPSGALTVRMVPRTNFCIVVSRNGRVHLVDLSHLDERFDAQGVPIAPNVLFPTAAKALAARRTYPEAVGAEDPRIVWTSEPGLSQGVLPPVVDADSGMLYTGDMNGTAMHAIAAIDPRIVMKVDIGDSGGLSEVGGVVPHGIDPPADILQKIRSLPPCGPQLGRCRENASLGTFRLEVTMPGAVAERLTASGGQFQVAVESERVAGAPAEQTPPGFPRSHLRRFRRDGSAEPTDRAAPNFRLRRVVPEDAALEKALRHQRGFNKFISPWIVAVADPRASSKYFWPVNMTPDDKADAGCRSCERPRSLATAGENDGVYELFTNGRVLSVRPELGSGGTNIFAGTPYAYLGEQNRLVTRFVTVMADTVRPPEIRVPGQNPAVAEGALQDTIYLHSGEYQVDAIDLSAGGRAGFDVVFDRSYRSRTIGGTILGQGWESSNLRRVRALPSGEVELRDLHGEVWVFTPRPNDVEYEAPRGYFQRLIRTDTGWLLLDQQSRATGFDQLGRLSFETDEFANLAALGAGTNEGNAIRYLYDASGRLTQIVDPVERVSELTYWQDGEAGQTGAYPGLLKRVSDWRGRTTQYEYDALGRLTNIKAPEAAAAAGVPPELNFLGSTRPRTEYTYQNVSLPPAPPTPSAAFNDYIEFIGNLASVKMPDQIAIPNGRPRVTVSYGNTAHPRDRIKDQIWATGETVTVDNLSPIDVTTKDALGQTRQYKLTDPRLYDGRMHIDEATVVDVPTIESGAISGPASVTRAFTNVNLFTDFAYNDEGLYTSILYPNGLTITNKWAYAKLPSDEGDREGSKAPGMVLESSTSTGPGLSALKTDVKYDKTNQNAKATPVAVQRGNDEREAQIPSRERLTVEMQEDGYSVVTEYSTGGLPVSVKKKEGQQTRQELTTAYFTPSSMPLIGRQRPSFINTTNNETSQAFRYDVLPNGGEKVTVQDEIRKTKSETHYDSWGRMTREIVTDDGSKTLKDETLGYDAAGRLAWYSRKQTDVGDVVTTYEYDAVGRQTKMTMTEAAVNGSATTLSQVTEHDFANLTITEHDPIAAGATGAKTVKKIDTLGRPRVTERIASSHEVIRSITAFDRHGAPSYTTDGVRVATLVQNDALGRELVRIDSQGVRTVTSWTEWNEPREVTTYDADDFTVAHSKNHYTQKGRLKATTEAASPAGARIARLTWEDGDTVQSARVGAVPNLDTIDPTGDVRVSVETYDASGRKTHVRMGPATAMAHPDPDKYFTALTMNYKGDYPETVVRREPRAGASVESMTTMVYDGLGRVIETRADSAKASTVSVYDEAGNVLSATAPGMTAAVATYDSRGLVQEATRPGGGKVKYTYDALGAMRVYEDEAGAKTSMITDGLGRVVRTNYPDSTFEETRYESVTGLVSATCDRAGQWLAFAYGPEGRVSAVYSGQDTSGAKLVVYEYNAAGRPSGVFNANAGITWHNYDLLGRPTITRSYRYANGSGLKDDADRVVLDVHTQEHEWSIYDERSSWTMPSAGMSVPPDNSPLPQWLRRVREVHDAGSNLTEQRTGYGNIINSASGRAVAKLASRQRAMTTGSDLLDTSYGYADGRTSGIALPASDGANNLALRSAQSTYRGVTVAGSANGRDVAERIARMRDLGAGNRVSDFAYDARGRLERSRLSTSGPMSIRPPTVDQYTAADFRTERAIPPGLDPSQHQALGAIAARVEATSWQATENPQAHQILSRRSYLDGMPVSDPRGYEFQGGRRTRDGDWQATFDEFGRLTAIANDIEGRRIEYTWGPNNRIVGRTAYRGPASAWSLEDRPLVLREDGLPAQTTFVWDPVADRLVATFAEGASIVAPVTAEAGLLRQYLHGDQGMDDPVRVLVADESGGVRAYLPILDEAGTGSLQAVLDASSGSLVERILYADAYGDAPRYLQGAVVDQLTFEAKKNAAGDLDGVTIRVHLSESIDAASVRDGMRLAVVDNGTVITTSTAVPTLPDPYTVQWELGAIQWTMLKGFGPALEIAVTDSLRLQQWGDSPVTSAPAWAEQLFGVVSTPDTPFALRQSFTRFDTFIGSIQPNRSLTTELYAMQDLYLAASTESKTKLLTGFKAAPFIEPATRLAYFRARWYDPSTGSWLTPDPRGYTDSSNLYAGFRNDPVNHADPTGTVAIVDNVVGCGASTLIGWGITELLGGDYTWADAAIDCGLGFATSGLSSIGHLRHLRHSNKFVRAGTRVAAEAALDVGMEVARHEWKGEDYTLSELLRGAALNAVLGEAGSYVQRKAAPHVRKAWTSARGAMASRRGVRFNTKHDPLREKFGPASVSHPDEYAASLRELREAGVELDLNPRDGGAMAFQPGRTGEPGKFVLEPEASIGALRHEMQHFYDYRDAGYPGLGPYLNFKSFWTMEYRAYMREIRFARSEREFGLARRLLQLAREDRANILERYGPGE